MTKRIIAVILCAVMVLALSGCGLEDADALLNRLLGKGGPTDDTDDDSTTIYYTPPENVPSVYWLNINETADEKLQKLAQSYTSLTGIRVTVETVGAEAYAETLRQKLDAMDAPTVFPLDDETYSIFSDYLYDLSGSNFSAAMLTDAFNRYDEDGRMLAAGLSFECAGMIVDKELLDEAGFFVSDIKDYKSLKAVADGILSSSTAEFAAFTSADPESFAGYYGNVYLNEPSVRNNLKDVWDMFLEDGAADAAGTAREQFAEHAAAFTLGTSAEYAELHEADLEAKSAETATEDTVASVSPEELDDELDHSEVVEGVEYRYGMIPLYTGADSDGSYGLTCWNDEWIGVNKEADLEDINATLDFLTWLVTDYEAATVLTEIYGVLPFNNVVEAQNRFLADANNLLKEGKRVLTVETGGREEWLSRVADALTEYAGYSEEELAEMPEPWESVDAVLHTYAD